MPFNPSFVGGVTGSRLTSGVTPYLINRAMIQALSDFNIVDPSRLALVMDDEGVPPEIPKDDRFITVRAPSFIWNTGEVATGDNSAAVNSQLMVLGQTRHRRTCTAVPRRS